MVLPLVITTTITTTSTSSTITTTTSTTTSTTTTTTASTTSTTTNTTISTSTIISTSTTASVYSVTGGTITVVFIVQLPSEPMEEGSGELDHSVGLLRREVVHVSTDEVKLRLPTTANALIGLVCELSVPCLLQLAILVHYSLEGGVLLQTAVPLLTIIFELFDLLLQSAHLALDVLGTVCQRIAAAREKLALRGLSYGPHHDVPQALHFQERSDRTRAVQELDHIAFLTTRLHPTNFLSELFNGL